MVTKPSHNSSATAFRRVGRIFLKILIGILALFIILVLLIQTAPVQNFARKKVVDFLEKKLQTRVAIGRINIGIPNKILLENIYIEDRQKDTLLSGGRVSANINMFKLINNDIEINDLEIEKVTAKIKRVLPDTVFNFQFIIDAFTTKTTTPGNTTDTSTVKMALEEIRLDKIRLVYNDAVAGSDMDIWLEHFDTDIETFDPVKQVYNVPVSNINGLRATIYQYKPLVEPQPLSQDMAEAAQPIPFSFTFKELTLKNILLDYKNDVSSFYTNLNLGDLNVQADNFDLQKKVITLDELQLNQTTAYIRLGKKEAAKEVVKQVKQEVKSQAQNDWRFVVSKIRFNNNNIDYDDDNLPRIPNGMDYAHLKAKELTLYANDFVFTMDSIAGEITRAEFNEQSGFILTKLETKFVYAAKQAYLQDLLLETPGTVIRRAASIQYQSIEALQKNIGSMQMDIDIENSHIQTKDILVFAPQLRSQPAFRDHSAVWFLNSRITGSLDRMQIHALQFRGFQNTRADLKGTINGLPDVNKLSGSFSINTLSTTKSDVESLIPKNTLPSNITLPDRIDLDGTVTGSMASMKADLDLRTNLGSASVDGTFGNLTTPANFQYNTVLNTRSLNLGKILENEESFGTVTADITAVGKGIDPKTANAKINGVIHSAVINKYNYSNVQLNGSIERQQLVADINVNDPNIHLALNAKSDLSAKFPAVQITANIDSIKTLPLNLTPEVLIYRGKVTGNFPVTDPKNLQGELLITNSMLVTKDQRFILDSVEVKAGRTDSGQFINVRSDAVNATLTGQYNLLQLGSVIQQSIQPYYSLVPNYKVVPVDPYDFSLNAHVINGPLLKVFVPGLQHLEPIAIRTHFATNEGFQANVNSPLIVFEGNRLENLNLNAGTNSGAIVLNATMQKFGSGTAMNLYSTTINASIANNRINFMVRIKDRNANDKYRMGGVVDQPEQGVYALTLRSDSLLLNSDPWTLAQNNLIRYNTNNSDINVSNFILGKGTQQLRIQSTSTAVNAPMQVNFGNFRIGTITGFLKQDTLLVDGVLNGQVVLSNITQQPTFTSDITVMDLTVMKDTLGNLALKVNNTTQNIFTAEGMLSGKGNDVALSGRYNIKPANQSTYDLTVDVRQLQMTSIAALSMGTLTRASGYINGKIDINGTFEKPDVNGSLNFNKAGFTPAILGSSFMVDQEKVNINQAGILFDTFTIRDSVNNTLVLDGYAYTTNFFNYRFDLDIKARNFQAINTTKRTNALYYGKLYFDSDLRVRGTETLPVIDGAVTINESTDFTVVMPQQQPGVADREGIVRFVDMDSIKIDTTMFAYDSLNKSNLSGIDVSVNIEVNRKATFSLIIDEANGDFVRMKGEAQLTGGIDKSGNITLTGSYEIEEGTYEISLNLLRRQFKILKGSKIIWLGEPTRADIDVTAVYIANTSPYTLVKQTLSADKIENYYKQKLPFEVHLKLTGQLLRPEINFDIRLPENKNFVAGTVTEDVEFRLNQLRQDPSELNKQVFSILLFNRFINENPFASEGGGFNAAIMARQSVSKLLAEQLNDLAADLIAGVEINFDIQSYEDYSTGALSNRSDLNVSLSKQLLNDRLKVTVGNNFQLEGAQNANQGNAASGLAGNIALDYQLSRDGRYMLRAYRKNEYEGAIEGYVIETGIRFLITLDYNHFRDLFRKRKKQPVQQPPTLPPNGDRKETAPVSNAPEAKLNEQE